MGRRPKEDLEQKRKEKEAALIPLTRKELDMAALIGGEPRMVDLVQNCHSSSDMWVRYDSETGEMKFFCGECNVVFARVKVATE